MRKKWKAIPKMTDAVRALAEEVKISESIAMLLWMRGIQTTEAARAFLSPEKHQPYYDPMLMKDMDIALPRILRAMEECEYITIYGDYDVDGMTATAVLFRTLKRLGARVNYYIPAREEGYGIHLDAIREIAANSSLVISVDCGISAVDEIKHIKEELEGLDIIITDHHLPGEILPKAFAVINPHRADCPYPNKNLAGVGVAYKLATAVAQAMGRADAVQEVELVAIGTIADMVPLLGENRKIVRAGLSAIKSTKILGLKALLEVTGLEGQEINARHIGFTIAPRLNAAGRMETAQIGAKLLLTEEKRAAQEIAECLDETNRSRQDTEQEILKRALASLADVDARQMSALVVGEENWHPGVIGIVASRLVEKFYRPTVVLSIQGDVAKGSCRSIPKLHLYETLCDCKEYLLGFGGHAQAAGLSMRTADIPKFREAFSKAVEARLSAEDFIPVLDVEFQMNPAEIDDAFMAELELLEPFGIGNAQPIFGVREVRANDVRTIGKEGAHLKFTVGRAGREVPMLAWHTGQKQALFHRENFDLAYVPEYNEWQGEKHIQCVVRHYQVSKSVASFPTREDLANIYRACKMLQEKDGTIPYDLAGLSARISEERPEISAYFVEAGMQIFRELGLVTESMDEQSYQMEETPRQKMDLEKSPTYRKKSL